MNIWLVAAAWMALALAASLISIRLGISVALVEILIGCLAGNVFHIQSAPWIDFLATFGSGLLTFLAGAEIDPASLKRHLKPALAIGAMGFFAPFIVVGLFAYFVAHWELHAAFIAGIALSTTSVAVVYAVMIESGRNRTELGKLILAACFINDLGTVLALGIVFAKFNAWLALFVAITALALWFMPAMTRFVIKTVGARVSEPELKFVFLVLFLLGGLAQVAKSEAVLPAYLIGLVIAGVFVRDKTLLDRMRTIAFTILTPFYFIKAGLYVSAPAMAAGAVLIGAFLFAKVASKFVGIRPLTILFKFSRRDGMYTTLLMSTGLTFGTISALFGLTNHIISQEQYTILVITVIGSALVPTFIAERWFAPPRVPGALAAASAIPFIEEASEIP